MNLLDMVNKVMTTTGLGAAVDTVENLDPNSDAHTVSSFIRDAQLDLSRKIPNASLSFYGNLSTVASTDTSLSGAGAVNGLNYLTVATANPTWAGRMVHVEGDSLLYRILSIDGAPSYKIYLADLAGNPVDYRGDTAASGTVTVMQDRYLLPVNFKRPISTQDFFGSDVMAHLSPEEFDVQKFRVDGAPFLEGRPTRFTIFGSSRVSGDESPRYYVEFDPIPDDVYHYPFRYEGSPVTMKRDGDISGYTVEYEMAIVTRARYYVYRYRLMNLESAAVEDRDWKDIVGDQRKNPVSSKGVAYMQPYSSRAHYSRAYDA